MLCAPRPCAVGAGPRRTEWCTVVCTQLSPRPALRAVRVIVTITDTDNRNDAWRESERPPGAGADRAPTSGAASPGPEHVRESLYRMDTVGVGGLAKVMSVFLKHTHTVLCSLQAFSPHSSKYET